MGNWFLLWFVKTINLFNCEVKIINGCVLKNLIGVLNHNWVFFYKTINVNFLKSKNIFEKHYLPQIYGLLDLSLWFWKNYIIGKTKFLKTIFFELCSETNILIKPYFFLKNYNLPKFCGSNVLSQIWVIGFYNGLLRP